jgi:2-polyprenyl-6-methoxyphenol hydroxylase-like FAD-dependent oxidoreductase
VDTQILVVGAGPTGLMLALQLRRLGLQPLLIDRHSGPAQQSRALGVQARTLEIYAQLGIAERALELGRRATGINLWRGSKPAARVPLGDIGRELSPFPYLLILGQDDNERLLGERLAQFGGEVQWNTELVALEQHEDGVVAQLRQPDGSLRRVEAAWVAGCDGAHSAVRELCGIGFPGAAYEQEFFVADTVAKGPMVPEEVNAYLWPRGFNLYFPMRGADHWRLVGILPPELRAGSALRFEDVLPSIRAQDDGATRFEACHWFSSYRIHHRCAERFRDRRCFLLGDAAHIHSPAGAQGMNTGLQDAWNLGWKLALVVQGRAPEALLDSYGAERLPVAQRLLQTTDRAFTAAVSDSTTMRMLRTHVIPRLGATAMRLSAARRLAFRTISQIGIQYRDSGLSQNLPGLPQGAPRGGERFPWLTLQRDPQAGPVDLYQSFDGLRFQLLLFGQPSPSLPGFERDVRSQMFDAGGENGRRLQAAGIPLPSFFLLRPDGYIGLAGLQAEPELLRRWLTRQVGLRS